MSHVNQYPVHAWCRPILLYIPWNQAVCFCLFCFLIKSFVPSFRFALNSRASWLSSQNAWITRVTPCLALGVKPKWILSFPRAPQHSGVPVLNVTEILVCSWAWRWSLPLDAACVPHKPLADPDRCVHPQPGTRGQVQLRMQPNTKW